MADYKHMYHIMFHAAENAIADIDNARYSEAKKRLIEAEQAAEGVYIGDADRGEWEVTRYKGEA